MRVLIIGGTGLTGPHIVRELAEGGHDVTVFHRGRTVASLPAGVHEMLGDRADLASQRDAFARLAPDVVLHMLAFTRADATLFVETFRGIAGRSIVISSADVYLAYGRLLGTEPGEPQPVPLAEDSTLRSHLSAEGEACDKIGVEAVVNGVPELPATVIRYPAVYGPGDRQRRFYPYFRRIDDSRPAILLGKDVAPWRFMHAYSENAAHAVVLAVTSDVASGRTYNVGELDTPSTAERVQRIGEVLDWRGRVVAVDPDALPPEMQEPSVNYEQQWVLDDNRIRTELGYTEVVSEDEAIRRTYAWDMQNVPEGDAPDYEAEDAALAAANE